VEEGHKGMHKVIETIQRTGTVTGRSGKTHKLLCPQKRLEGMFLYNLIRADAAVAKTLEIGCAQGLSSLHICAATEDRENAWHTIIDPHQNTHWDGVGITNLDTAGLDSFDLIEKKSEFALPELLQREEAQFDLVLVNGWHTFDHALVDCFYATRLLRLGGYLVLDSVALSSLQRLVDLLNKWPCYEEFASIRKPLRRSALKQWLLPFLKHLQADTWSSVLPSPLYKTLFRDDATKMVAFIKSDLDQRGSGWHDERF